MRLRIISIFCLAIVLGVCFWAQPSAVAQAQADANLEAALRKRVGEFYTLLKVKRTIEAEKYVTADSLEQFRLMPIGDFIAAEISSIEWGADKKSAGVLIDLIVSGATIPVPFSLPRRTDWKLESDGWRIVIPPQTVVMSSAEYMFPGSGKLTSPPVKKDLEFSKPVVDLNPIKQGEKKIAKFPFSNVSSHPVTITDVKSDCKCIVLISEKKTYKPGETGEIALEFDSTDYAYAYRQTVAVYTSPDNQRSDLMLSASIAPKQ